MKIKKTGGIIGIQSFSIGGGGEGPGSGGNDSDNNVFEAWRCTVTASFSESGFDTHTCNSTASFQENIT